MFPDNLSTENSNCQRFLETSETHFSNVWPKLYNEIGELCSRRMKGMKVYNIAGLKEVLRAKFWRYLKKQIQDCKFDQQVMWTHPKVLLWLLVLGVSDRHSLHPTVLLHRVLQCTHSAEQYILFSGGTSGFAQCTSAAHSTVLATVSPCVGLAPASQWQVAAGRDRRAPEGWWGVMLSGRHTHG